MTERVNVNKTSNFGDFEDLSLDATKSKNNDGFNLDDWVDTEPNEAEINRANPLQGGKVSGGVHVGDKMAAALDKLNMSKPRNGFWSSVGRFFLKILSVFNSTKVENSDVLISKQGDLRNKNLTLKPLPELKSQDIVKYDTANLGRAMGLGDRVHVEPFKPYGDSGDAFKDLLFPRGEPYLHDIKQDPGFQDCWFLSSIGAVLSQKGTEAITRLFEPSSTQGMVNVRLGGYKFEVPAGDICTAKGDRVGSQSANWVRLLETAMQMYNLKLQETSSNLLKSSTKMVYRDPTEGLCALLNLSGCKTYAYQDSLEEKLTAVKDALGRGDPVVLGHAEGLMGAVKDGISPQHAVTLLDYSSQERKILVLDPYGQVKSLPESALARFAMRIAESPAVK